MNDRETTSTYTFPKEARIHDELASERRWETAFANSAGLLAQLADEALAEHRQGRTQVLDPDK